MDNETELAELAGETVALRNLDLFEMKQLWALYRNSRNNFSYRAADLALAAEEQWTIRGGIANLVLSITSN